MAEKDWRSDVRIVGDIESRRDEEAAAGGDEEPFIIAVVGDFTGAGEPTPLSARRFTEIDRDNFDAVLAKFNPSWEGSVGGSGGRREERIAVRLRFRELDDFHPDRVLEQIPTLRKLADTRQALNDPKRFESAAAEIMKWSSVPTGAPAEEPTRKPLPHREVKPGELLDRILDGGEGSPLTLPREEPRDADLQRFLQEIVGPHLVRVNKARQDELIDAVDRSLSEQMRSVFHDRAFRRLEATWRGLRWLVYRTETAARLKIRLVQLTKKELQEELRSGAPLEDSVLARLLLEPASTPGGVHPSLLVGNYEFGNDDEDLALLTVIGAIAESLEAPFIVGATPGLLGCRHFSELPSAGDLEQRLREPVYRNWQALRSSSFAQWLALALPRWLCRLPYGSDTEPIESFTFEEQLDGEHETLLWTSPAWAVTAVVADAFASHGWGFDVSSTVGRLEGLPLYVYREAGNTVTKPCAELVLNERSAGVLGETGLIPLVSYWQQDAVALPYIQSLAHVPLRWRLQRG